MTGDAEAPEGSATPAAPWRLDDVPIPELAPGAMIRYAGPDHTFPYVSYYQALEADKLLREGNLEGASKIRYESIPELEKKIAELERAIGQKQVQLDFKDKMIELAEQLYGIDIKKKFESTSLSGTGNTGRNSTVV